MRCKIGRLAAMVGAFLFVFVAGIGFAQTATTTETKNFEVISVDGNKVVARDASGATKEYTLPDDFQFTVGGKQISVHELKPGMKGTATITTKTTTVPVHVTEVRNGEVVKADAATVIIRGEKGGYQMFNQGDVDKKKVQIVRGGKPVKITDLHVGDRLSATLITEGTPQVMTEREVQASITHHGTTAPPAKAAAAKKESAAPAPAATETTEAAPAAKKLPPTGSPLPLLALIGMASLAVGFALRSRRLQG
jgi:hypothetical protein